MKLTPADRWFSKCIKLRVNYVCERCGTQYQEGDRGLHCSHFIGRRNWAVRFDPANAFAHCFGCHQHLGENPAKFVAWTFEAISGNEYYAMTIRANNIDRGKKFRRTKGKGDISAHFKEQFEIMQKARNEGVTGRLEFVGYL